MLTTPQQRLPRCALVTTPPIAWRVTLDLPDGGAAIDLRLLAATAADVALTALELAGPGSRVRRVQRQGEWA